MNEIQVVQYYKEKTGEKSILTPEGNYSEKYIQFLIDHFEKKLPEEQEGKKEHYFILVEDSEKGFGEDGYIKTYNEAIEGSVIDFINTKPSFLSERKVLVVTPITEGLYKYYKGI